MGQSVSFKTAQDDDDDTDDDDDDDGASSSVARLLTSDLKFAASHFVSVAPVVRRRTADFKARVQIPPFPFFKREESLNDGKEVFRTLVTVFSLRCGG